MNILVSFHEDTPEDFNVALLDTSREEYEKEKGEGEIIIHYEPLFGKEGADYSCGEGVISAIGHCADGDSDNPGTALESLAKQMFLLGRDHGVKTERNRIIARVAGHEADD